MDALVVNNISSSLSFRLKCKRSRSPKNKVVPKWKVINRNRGLKVVEESGKKDFATKCMSGIDKAGQ